MENVSKFKKFTEEHQNVWQLIKFTLISMIAGATEMGSYLLLNSVFLKSLNSQPFHWWIFHYAGGLNAGGLGTMIAFLVSTTLAQIISFVTNRKKTFNANNNVLYAAVTYTIMVVIIICLQTYTGPLIVSKIDSALNMYEISSVLGKCIWMFLTFCIVFLMSKFVIMRRVEEKPKEQPDDEKPKDQ